MRRLTRRGDISQGICTIGAACCLHTWVSVHVGGSKNVSANRRAAMRRGDIGSSTCPHCPTSWGVSASRTVSANRRGLHRRGDVHVVGCGTGVVISASPNVFIGK